MKTTHTPVTVKKIAEFEREHPECCQPIDRNSPEFKAFQSKLSSMTTTPFEFQPLKVMPCPMWAGKHIQHDHRYIATADAEVEWPAWNQESSNDWRLSEGSIICQMRDVNPRYAKILASAPELLKALEAVVLEHQEGYGLKCIDQARAAIAKARGENLA